MVESRLPWWLVLLLGVWVAGLSIWSWPRAQREVRWGAGLLSLVYLVLLFTALGGDPRTVQTSSAVPRGAATGSWAFAVTSAMTVLAGVFLLGRPSGRGQLAWFLGLTVGNAASCLVCGAAAAGGTLLAVSAVIGIVLARDLRQGPRPMWCEWLPAPRSASIPVGLVGATGFVLALLLVGTLRYTVRVETSRATASHRFSAIPSVDRVRAVLETDAAPRSTAGPFELAFGRRADVIVLLAALAFLVLAMHNPSRRVPGVSKVEDGHACPSGLGPSGVGREEPTGRSAPPPNLLGDGISPHGGTA
ncbi:MAG: hypothetical protein AABP62_01835 [Planctomycetota bacterium]